MKNRKIRILFIGDDNVGKTSLISTLISDSFPETVEKVIAPVLIPPEMYMQANDTSIILIDSSSDPANEAQTNEEIKDADVIMALYDITNNKSAERLKNYWLPRVAKINDKVHVIIIGNKLDLAKGDLETYRIHDIIKPLLKEFKQVQMGLECSALLPKNLPEVIYCAQKVVLFPLTPLYNTSSKTLKTEFVRAIKRIFRICDRDKDGRLSDNELKSFQHEVFKGELTESDIKGIKEVIKNELGNNSNENGITLEGFIALQKKFIETMKIQTCWSILRHFGYNDNLQISENEFKDSLLLDESNSQSVELSGYSISFIKALFHQYSNGNLFLNFSQILQIFDPITSLPWTNIERIVHTEIHNDEICINLNSWIALWHLLTNQDYQRCYKFLKYIGFEGNLADAFHITNKKETLTDLMKTQNREVINVFVIGHEGCGKTQLLEHMINNKFNEIHVPTPSPRSIISLVYFPNGKKKHIIFTEFPIIEVELLLKSEEKMKKCDMLFILYSNETKGENFLKEYANIIPEYVPRFLVKTKCESSSSASFIFKIDLSNVLRISPVQIYQISVKNNDIDPLKQAILNTLEKPTTNLPNSMILKLEQRTSFLDKYSQILLYGVSVIGVSLLAIYGCRKYSQLLRSFR